MIAKDLLVEAKRVILQHGHVKNKLYADISGKHIPAGPIEDEIGNAVRFCAIGALDKAAYNLLNKNIFKCSLEIDLAREFLVLALPKDYDNPVTYNNNCMTTDKDIDAWFTRAIDMAS